MSQTIILLLLMNTALLAPLVFIIIKREYFKHKYELSKKLASLLGFLISINGAIRAGKTSFQSGLSHIFQIEIEEKLKNLLLEVRIIYKKIDFQRINNLLDELFKKSSYPNFKEAHQLVTKNLKQYNMSRSLIHNFLSSRTSYEMLKDYIFAYWVLNYRKNYVHSKTNFYSHITASFNYDYDIEQQKIFEAYTLKDYAIYDFMVELIDEASDEIGANKRYEDVKEESGNKDYRRKYGQIHQERNRMITTKQDVKDEIKKFRTLTQSNLWLPSQIKVVGDFKFTYELISFLLQLGLSIYRFINIWIPYMYKRITDKNYKDIEYEVYKDNHFSTINIERKILNKLLHIKWFLKSIAYNTYEIWNYPSEDDVKKRDPIYYDKLKFYIPTIYCFGTYETHFYRMIQEELLNVSETQSTEINMFFNPSYFEDEDEMGGDIDDINF